MEGILQQLLSDVSSTKHTHIKHACRSALGKYKFFICSNQLWPKLTQLISFLAYFCFLLGHTIKCLFSVNVINWENLSPLLTARCMNVIIYYMSSIISQYYIHPMLYISASLFSPENIFIKVSIFIKLLWLCQIFSNHTRGHRGHDRMIVGFTTTCTICAYHH